MYRKNALYKSRVYKYKIFKHNRMCKYIKYDKKNHDRSKLDVSNNTLYILLLNQFIPDLIKKERK